MRMNCEPFSTPETRAALAHVKGVLLRSAFAPPIIDERVLALIGEPVETIEEGIEALRRETAEGLAQCEPPWSSTRINAFSFALGELVRDRLQEFERRGRGRG
jgi:hypothetical protein